MRKAEPEKKPNLKKLFPNLSEAELERVEETLEDYVQSTLRLYERLESDPEAYARFQKLLTRKRRKERKRKGAKDGK